jgi:CHAT domain-containing protein
LYAVHPELRMRRGDIEPATAEEAAALLPGTRAAILSYTVTPSETLVFAATHKGGGAARVVRIPVAAADLDRRVTRFREQLAARDLSYRETARALYTLLLGPVRAELQGITDLVIVPDGPLWHLPFQALESPAGRALLQECALSYAPSVTVLRELAGRPRRQAGLGLLAIGNPPPRPGTEPLPEAERELRAVAALYGAGSRAYTGSGASEARFKGEAGGYRVVHVATHGVFDDRSPMHSYLSLAPGGGAEEEDGLLEARELLEANLGADLVVLAACETGRGRAQRGEGLIGMTWALLAAGSPTAVASQWKVDSTATTELMLEFHRQWRTRGAPPGPTRAGALRRAALKVMEQPRFRHPFYWAGFVLVGNGF